LRSLRTKLGILPPRLLAPLRNSTANQKFSRGCMPTVLTKSLPTTTKTRNNHDDMHQRIAYPLLQTPTTTAVQVEKQNETMYLSLFLFLLAATSCCGGRRSSAKTPLPTDSAPTNRSQPVEKSSARGTRDKTPLCRGFWRTPPAVQKERFRFEWINVRRNGISFEPSFPKQNSKERGVL